VLHLPPGDIKLIFTGLVAWLKDIFVVGLYLPSHIVPQNSSAVFKKICFWLQHNTLGSV
jgi:G:T-mismatch repair DNA endonuclease (very short patch repair protein)